MLLLPLMNVSFQKPTCYIYLISFIILCSWPFLKLLKIKFALFYEFRSYTYIHMHKELVNMSVTSTYILFNLKPFSDVINFPTSNAERPLIFNIISSASSKSNFNGIWLASILGKCSDHHRHSKLDCQLRQKLEWNYAEIKLKAFMDGRILQ